MIALEFIGDLSTALFPPVIVLVAAASWRRAAWRPGPALRFVLVAIAVTLLLRLGFAFSLVPISTRYFLSLTILLLPLAAGGVDPAAAWLAQGWQRFGRGHLAQGAARNIILALVFIPFLGKGLKPEKYDKAWLQEIPRLVTAEAGGALPVLVSELDDLRMAYFAGARHLKLCRDGEVICRHAADGTRPRQRCFGGELAEHGLREFSEHWQELPGTQGWPHLTARLGELPGVVFLVVCQEDAAFREQFARHGLPFPFRLIREFRGHRGDPVLLYRWSGDA